MVNIKNTPNERYKSIHCIILFLRNSRGDKTHPLWQEANQWLSRASKVLIAKLHGGTLQNDGRVLFGITLWLEMAVFQVMYLSKPNLNSTLKPRANVVFLKKKMPNFKLMIMSKQNPIEGHSTKQLTSTAGKHQGGEWQAKAEALSQARSTKGTGQVDAMWDSGTAKGQNPNKFCSLHGRIRLTLVS